MVKFDEVWSKNKRSYLLAEDVLNELDLENPSFQNDTYYCPSCKQVELIPVIYTNYCKKYFRTLKNAIHEEGCNFSVTSIPQQYVVKPGSNNQIIISEQEKRSLLNRYRLHHNNREETSQKINRQSSNTIDQSKPHQIKENRKEIPKAKLDRYFKNKIFEIYKDFPKDTRILYLIYGDVYIKPLNTNKLYNNYQICLQQKNDNYSILCSIGLNKIHDSDKIQYIKSYLNRPVHVVMIGYLSVHYPFLNFNLLSGNSLIIEML